MAAAYGLGAAAYGLVAAALLRLCVKQLWFAHSYSLRIVRNPLSPRKKKKSQIDQICTHTARYTWYLNFSLCHSKVCARMNLKNCTNFTLTM
ncbi:hypothetical protein BD289DRAFT_430455, partial [Coniella lustricola]